MDPLTAIAASGLRARMESLDLLANNLANGRTGGYKSDREFYTLYRAAEVESAGSTMPEIERHWTDFSQGALESTGNPLDLALSGKGFFAVDGPGGTLYTRNGSFRIAPGGRLITAEGYPVRAKGDAGIILDPGRPVEISKDGTVQQEGRVIGELEIAGFAATSGLQKQGRTYFRNAAAGSGPAPATGVSIEQGKLEASNVGTAESSARLLGVMRQFEMLQKAISLAGEMNRRAVEEVARVGSQ